MSDLDVEPKGVAPPLFAILFLPCGLGRGFVTVTLGYILARHGVSVVAISGLVGLQALATTLQFVAGPVVDMSLSSGRWYLITVAALAASFVGFAVAPLTAAGLPLLGALSFAIGAASVAAGAAVMAAVALTIPDQKRGAVAGWMQVGLLGGTGLGGGLGLWIGAHAGGPRVAAVTLAVLCLGCALPLLWMRIPRRPPGMTLTARARDLGVAVWTLARTRRGPLAVLALTLPAGLGAAISLLPAAAASWRASADLVAVVTGLFGGLASVPGCIVGGYLCDRFPRRTVYMWAALACAGGEAAMAVAPHTPAAFGVFGLLNAMLLGVAWGAVTAVNFDCLGRKGAATVGATLSSLSNVPVVLVTVLVGWAETRHGASAMLLTESGLAVVAIAGYATLAWLWRPEGKTAVASLATT